MKESTGKWLDPLQSAAREAGLDIQGLMQRASMPVREADNDTRLAKLMTSWEDQGQDREMGVRYAAINWIRYGQLIRDALGWTDYPEFPEDE